MRTQGEAPQTCFLSASKQRGLHRNALAMKYKASWDSSSPAAINTLHAPNNYSRGTPARHVHLGASCMHDIAKWCKSQRLLCFSKQAEQKPLADGIRDQDLRQPGLNRRVLLRWVALKKAGTKAKTLCRATTKMLQQHLCCHADCGTYIP